MQAIVKVKEDPFEEIDKVLVVQTNNKVTLKDLLAGTQDNNHYHAHYILTIFWWVACSKTPFSIEDSDAIDGLQKIWDVRYPNIPYKIEVNDAVCKLVHTPNLPTILLTIHHC
jgi:hypothetical protein